MNPYYDQVPYDSFMGRYLRFMSTQETAHDYDWWCGLWTLACACGRGVVVARPRAPVFLNMYLILVGDSGIPRKTTSVNMAAGLVHELHMAEQDVHLMTTLATPEQLELILHTRSKERGSAQIAIAVPELATFMGAQAYTASVPPLLTDLYDCPASRRGGGTVQRGESIQQNVWVSLLTASTQIWLLQAVNPRVVEGGFTSRCLFIVSNKPKQSIPWPSDEDTSYERSLIMDELIAIKKQATLCPEISMAPAAMEAFTVWYASRQHNLDPFSQSFEAREDSHVLRVAALLSINDGAWEIQYKHIRLAIKLIGGVKVSSNAIFEQGLALTKISAALERIRMDLIAAGEEPTPRHVLSRRCIHWITLQEFNAIIEIMLDLEMVKKFFLYPTTSSHHSKGRPSTYYMATSKLMERGVSERILERFN